jgi:integrase
MAIRKRSWKTPNGEPRTSWQYSYTGSDGKRYAKQFKTKSEAIAHETRVRAELAQGTHVSESSSCTVDEAAELWIRAGEHDGLEATTIRQRVQHRKHLKPFIGHERLVRLTTPRIEALKDQLVEKKGRPMARRILTSLKGILAEARRRGLIGHDPAASVRVIVRRAEAMDDERAPIPSKSEIKLLLSKAQELWPSMSRLSTGKEQKVLYSPWRVLFNVALFTGLRQSEIRGLRWADIDLKAARLSVRQRADRWGKIGVPKSKAGKRDIPLAPGVLNLLREWKLVSPKFESDLVFPNEHGRPILGTNLYHQGWLPLLKACGLFDEVTGPKITFHSLRHAFASLMIEARWQPKKVQATMGHSSIQVTYDVYGKLFEEHQHDADAIASIEVSLLR